MILASAFEQTVAVSDPCFTAIEDQIENLFLRQEMLVKILALSTLSGQILAHCFYSLHFDVFLSTRHSLESGS